MDLSEVVNNNAGLKTSDIDKTNIGGGSSALMTLEIAENVVLKHDEKRTRKKQSKEKKLKKFSISEAVMEYLETVKEPNGAIVESILDYLQSRYKVNKHLMKRNVVRFLQTAVQNGVLEQDSGTGDAERFRIKKVGIAKTGKKKMKGKTSSGVYRNVKLFNSDAYQLIKTDVERTGQRMKNKKFDVVEENEQQSKVEKNDVVEKSEQQSSIKKKDVVKKSQQQSSTKKKDIVEKSKQQSSIKKKDVVEKSEQQSSIKKKNVEKSEQQSSIKKKDVGKIVQPFKIENKVVEKDKQKMKTKRAVVKKDEQKLKAREGKKIKTITQRLKNSDDAKKDKQQPKLKKADGKVGRQGKKAAIIKEKESLKKPKRKTAKK